MKFTELLKNYHVTFTQNANWVQMDCPFCAGGHGKRHLGFNTYGGYGNCWKCGQHSLVEIIREHSGKSWGESRSVAKTIDIFEKRPTEKQHTGRLKKPKESNHELLPAHVTYLHSRGFNPTELVRLWHISGIGIGCGFLSWRIFIPIYFRGVEVSWTTRSISDKNKMKYISADPMNETMEHKKILYGADFARRSIIICEGPTDVWNVGPGAVCTFGVNWSPHQLLRMSLFSNRIICYDSSDDAQQRARRLANELSIYPGQTNNVVLDAADPGSASKREIKLLRKLLK